MSDRRPSLLCDGESESLPALRAVLHGEDRGAHRDCLLLGAALALEVAGRTRSAREGIEAAAAAIDSGAARRTVDAVADFARARPGAA